MPKAEPSPPPTNAGLWLAVLGVGLLIAAGAWIATRRSTGAAAETNDRPATQTGTALPPVHVVIYLIDTLRADRLSVYGYGQPTSPHFDALAAEAVVFEQAYAPAPWTLPSVVSLLTSTFACEHGVVLDGQKVNAALRPLAVRLKEAGYRTGSLYANQYASAMSGLDAGYDTMETRLDIDAAMVNQWFEHAGPGPYYLYVHTIEPHDPHRTPETFIAPFGPVPLEMRREIQDRLNRYRSLTRADFSARRAPGTTENSQEQTAAMARILELIEPINLLYDASVRWADDNLGRIVEVLKLRGLWDDTLFIVLADHGEELGDHGGWLHDQSVYQELVHVPLVIHFPHGQFAGRRVREVVSLLDVIPTIAEALARPELSAPARGSSLLPAVRGPTGPGAHAPRVVAVRENRKKYYRPYKEVRGDLNVALRHGDLKAIWNAEPQTLELFDLRRDPAERHDLSAEQAPQARELAGFAQSWLDACRGSAGETTPGGIERLDPQALQRLRSLGYVD